MHVGNCLIKHKAVRLLHGVLIRLSDEVLEER
jgi:hypothetical protein